MRSMKTRFQRNQEKRKKKKKKTISPSSQKSRKEGNVEDKIAREEKKRDRGSITAGRHITKPVLAPVLLPLYLPVVGFGLLLLVYRHNFHNSRHQQQGGGRCQSSITVSNGHAMTEATTFKIFRSVALWGAASFAGNSYVAWQQKKEEELPLILFHSSSNREEGGEGKDSSLIHSLARRRQGERK